jgi:hypothetical protein
MHGETDMNPHTVFYYPYGSFQDRQTPLLKAAALYLDKLYILDPEKASSGTIGAVEVADDVRLSPFRWRNCQ